MAQLVTGGAAEVGYWFGGSVLLGVVARGVVVDDVVDGVVMGDVVVDDVAVW